MTPWPHKSLYLQKKFVSQNLLLAKIYSHAHAFFNVNQRGVLYYEVLKSQAKYYSWFHHDIFKSLILRSDSSDL